MSSPFRHSRYVNSQFLEENYQIADLSSAAHVWCPQQKLADGVIELAAPLRRDSEKV